MKAKSFFTGNRPEPSLFNQALDLTHHMDEEAVVLERLEQAELAPSALKRIHQMAHDLVQGMRAKGANDGGLDAFMHEFDLSNSEGVVLMCLAESLLRIPDSATADKLIKDKIADADWASHLGRSGSAFVNASTWALMLTGRVIKLDEKDQKDASSFLKRLISRSGEPVIRQAMVQAMRIMGRQFVLGRTIDEALQRGAATEARGYRYSFDMLGEAAHTAADAEAYFQAYANAIAAIGKASKGRGVVGGPGVSVKLSALHPRYHSTKHSRVMSELLDSITRLCRLAAEGGIGLCIDAEEADRLEISMEVLEAVSGDKALKDWQGLGLAVQAYQKRAFPLLDFLDDMAGRHKRRFMVRLVKGAYWDTEIKRAQVEGMDGYPVFTRKASTDVSYMACIKRLFQSPASFFPQFATHNAHTVAAVLEMAGKSRDFEFQRLHGMGESLFDQVTLRKHDPIPCRVYAPVGSHEDLLAYLVRRLLENGANSSFVNRIVDEQAPIDDIIADPIARVAGLEVKRHPNIPLPKDIYGGGRTNSRGLDIFEPQVLKRLTDAMEKSCRDWRAAPLVGGASSGGEGRVMTSPANRHLSVGRVVEATEEDVEKAVARAKKAAPDWDRVPANTRASYLEKTADLMEENSAELMSLCTFEAGKTVDDGLAEVREAVDFLRYYALRARLDFAEPEILPGPTGESNSLSLHGRGVFAAISPWNFPLAIFTGQVSAALAAGNTVVAKPAEQTPLIATRAVELMHKAGIPGDVLHLLPGDGPTVGAPMVGDERVAGVVFTGSVEVAQLINRTLAAKSGAISPLIAETGGQNAMIVDSTALPEQVVEDAVMSAFRSAGQRCSAMRVMFVQQDVAERMIKMLAGAVEELRVGDPSNIETDVGPVIDAEALATLQAHAEHMDRTARKLCQAPLTPECSEGTFFAPRAYQIESLDKLQKEVFGPIAHIIPYAASKLDQVIDAVNGSGFGLTMGVHTRVDATRRYIVDRLNVGNAYINRNMIGAVVGVQPFGGEGLSGTGPKAGGPRYLHRFATERTVSMDTTASGGNAALMSLSENGEDG